MLVVCCWLMVMPPVADDEAREALARFGLGVYHARRDMPASAQAQFQAAAKLQPKSVEIAREQLKLHVLFGRYATAIRTAKEILATDPADTSTAQTLGQLYHDGNNFTEAVKTLRTLAARPELAQNPARKFGVLADLVQACRATKDTINGEAALTALIALLQAERATLLSTPGLEDAKAYDRELARRHEQLGDALMARAKFAEAEAAYRQANIARIDWNLAGVLIEQKRFAEAQLALERYLPNAGQTLEHFERYALVLNRQGSTEETVRKLQALTRKLPNRTALDWVIAGELLKANPADGITKYQRLVSKTTDPEAMSRFVSAMREANRLDLLLDQLQAFTVAAHEDAIQRDANALERNRALVQAMKADSKLGLPLLKIWTERAAGQHDDLNQLMIYFCERADQLDMVEKALRAQQNGNSKTLPRAIFANLMAQRKWSEAVDFCDEATLRRNPMDLTNWPYFRVRPLLELGKGPEALQALNQAEKNAASPYDVVLERAHILTQLDRPTEALQTLDKLLKQTDEKSFIRQARLYQAEAYNALKQYDKADAAYEMVLEDDPDDVLVLNNIAYHAADQGRRLAEAEEWIRRAIEADQDAMRRLGKPDAARGTYLDTLGWILFRRGKLAEAKAAFTEAKLSTDAGGDAVIWDHAGDVHFRLREYAEARKSWERAYQLYDNTHQGRQMGRRDEVKVKLQQIP
jgi:tetratricopeptide (TPR) repeat protein